MAKRSVPAVAFPYFIGLFLLGYGVHDGYAIVLRWGEDQRAVGYPRISLGGTWGGENQSTGQALPPFRGGKGLLWLEGLHGLGLPYLWWLLSVGTELRL